MQGLRVDWMSSAQCLLLMKVLHRSKGALCLLRMLLTAKSLLALIALGLPDPPLSAQQHMNASKPL